jgi:DNA invertase Pin-like site-specific DNA recombinase
MAEAAIYCRISRDPDGTELGVNRQQADCRRLCDQHDLAVVDVLVDDDTSAYSGSHARRMTDCGT